MASGSYARKSATRQPAQTQSLIPPRATRKLEEIIEVDEEADLKTESFRAGWTRALEAIRPKDKYPVEFLDKEPKPRVVVDQFAPRPLERHRIWLHRLMIAGIIGLIFIGILLTAGMAQRPTDAQLVNFFGGKVYDVQVGGILATTQLHPSGPLPPKVPIPTNVGPYGVVGKPTLNADFINRVLASYNSPAAGKGQALYDLGVKYNIDPAFALAFFLHESTMGTAGEARSSLSLGNLRCIPNYKCQDGYAWFNSWEDGFNAWYALIRNLYVDYWGRVTVEQIIPKYAPTADNNNEAAYIASLKHSIDTWHAGVLQP